MSLQRTARRGQDGDGTALAARARVAPGKRPLTANLPPVQRKTEPEVAPRPAEVAPLEPGAEEEGAAGQVSTQDIQYEVIAHRIGYQDAIGEVEGELLARWGYQAQWAARINDAATGFFAGLILPDDQHRDLLTPIVVFRGTEGFRDIVSDIHPVAVGYDEFSQNQRFVQQLIAEAGGRVDVTGHSLGGALAQHAAAAFTGSVRRVVTFQSPGIAAGQAQAFSGKQERPEVTHHIAGGDVVDTAGDAHLEGEVFRHTPGGGPTSHTKFLLTTPEFQEQRDELGLTDDVLARMGIDKQTNRRPVERHEQYPHPVKSAIDETVRRGVGVGVYPILNGISVLNRNDDAALREQIASAGEDGLMRYPVSERAYMIDRLCRGMTGNADEEAILSILRASARVGDAVSVIDVTGAYVIASSLHGSQYQALRALYREHYYRRAGQEQVIAIIRRCMDGMTAEWEEEMIADILVDRSDGREIITRIGAIDGRGGFAEGLDKLQWQLDGGDQRRIDAIYAR